jgi:hypothetical protein
VPRRASSSGSCRSGNPQRWVETYYVQRTRFESIAERKLRRQLTDDGNVKITCRDLRDGSAPTPASVGARQ